MVLRPIYRLQVATRALATGTMTQVAHVSTDTYETLYAATGLEKEGAYFEPNIKKLMGAPTPLYEDLVLADWTTTGGAWEEVMIRSLAVKSLSQKDATAGVSWSAVSPAGFLTGNDAFSLFLRIGPPAKDATHDRDNWYRHVIFPADGPFQYRFSLHYGETPRLELSTDSGTTWTRLGDIPSGVDLTRIRHGENVEVTLSFMQMDGVTLCYLGDMHKHTYYHRQDGELVGATPAGTLKIEGMNGVQQFAMARIRFPAQWRYHSYALPGPANMNGTPQFIVQPATPSGEGVSVVGQVEEIDRGSHQFTYTLEANASPLADPNAAYSATTPLVESCTIVWPARWVPPPSAGWQDVFGVREIVTRRWFDLNTGYLQSMIQFALDNNFAQRRIMGGVQAVQLLLGYAHTGLFPQGRWLANTQLSWESRGAESVFTSTGQDLSFILMNQPLRDDIYPSRWCFYALLRLLLQHAGIVPDLQVRIPGAGCAFGPDPPGCPHPKFEAHPGFKTPRKVLDCMEEVRGLLAAWMGQDLYGQYRFEPFDWAPTRYPVKTFLETAGNDFGQAGGAVNEILAPFLRERDMREVVNDINLIGFDQSTGQIFLRHVDNEWTWASKNNPNSPNYLGFARPLISMNSLYATPEIADFVAANAAAWVPLPVETITMRAYGQPTIFPGDIVSVTERRTVGVGVRYWTTDSLSTWTPDAYFTTLKGRWIGLGLPPGFAS